MDGCVDHILSLNRTDIEVQSGNFSSWMINFERQQEFELARNERLKKDVSRLQKSAKRSAVWSDRVEASKKGAADKGYVGHKAAKMMKRSKAIKARQQHNIEQRAALLKNTETADPLKIHPRAYHTDLFASFSNVSVVYNGSPVCNPVSFKIRSGERIAIEGKNGSGKSSLLKLLKNAPIEHTGSITTGSGLVISYVPQDTSHLKGTLSEFAKSLCEQAHLYVWDEPLNFIDVYTRMQIEELIKKFSPTMLFVEHDIAFRNTIATRIVKI